MPLRDYQQESVDKAMSWIKSSLEFGVLDLATGAGKSHIVAALAEKAIQAGCKKVLCLAPSKELVEQNREKYLLTGEPASIFSGSAGKKCLKHNVVFGTEKTVLNSINKFSSSFGLIIIDECHGITPTIKKIITEIKSKNGKLRVVGLTATPYRLGTGYIYRYKEDGSPVSESQTRDPYFNKLIHRVAASELIDRGFLTQPHADPEVIAHYDTSNLELNSMGRFTKESQETAYKGKGRLTADIVADIVEKSKGRNGVIIFCATRDHAKEVMLSLPKENSKMLTGDDSKLDREQHIKDFKNQKFKYFVNVQVLTTGFDAPHIDVVAILRRTESVGLLQQIIGRGLRLYVGKSDCLVLDYAENIENHCPDGDLFNPEIKTIGGGLESDPVGVICPSCGVLNEVKLRKNDEGFDFDENGYFIDLAGERILNDDDQPMPAHYGRRCFGQSIIKGLSERCDYRWTHKVCEDCGHENDIAARFCEECKGELVDPNEKLKIEFAKIKKDPYSASVDKVLSWNVRLSESQRGNKMIRVTYVTECRAFDMFYMISKRYEWVPFCKATLGRVVESEDEYIDAHWECETKMPFNIRSYREKKGSRFYKVEGYNFEDTKLA